MIESFVGQSLNVFAKSHSEMVANAVLHTSTLWIM